VSGTSQVESRKNGGGGKGFKFCAVVEQRNKKGACNYKSTTKKAAPQHRAGAARAHLCRLQVKQLKEKENLEDRRRKPAWSGPEAGKKQSQDED